MENYDTNFFAIRQFMEIYVIGFTFKEKVHQHLRSTGMQIVVQLGPYVRNPLFEVS